MLPEVVTAAEGHTAWRKLGKVRLGIKVKNANGVEYPKDVNYFVIPEEYRKYTGEQPTELPIVLMRGSLFNKNDPRASMFDTRAAMYNANQSKFCHTVDGVRAIRHMKPEGSDKFQDVEIPCPGLDCEYRRNKKCAAKGYFNFRIASVPEVGEFVMIFGSKVAQAQILKTLQVVQMLTQGREKGMYGIRMKLRRVEITFHKDLDGSGLKKITKFIPQLEIDWESLLATDKQMLGPAMGMPIPILPAELDADAAPDDEETPLSGERDE